MVREWEDVRSCGRASVRQLVCGRLGFEF